MMSIKIFVSPTSTIKINETKVKCTTISRSFPIQKLSPSPRRRHHHQQQLVIFAEKLIYKVAKREKIEFLFKDLSIAKFGSTS